MRIRCAPSADRVSRPSSARRGTIRCCSSGCSTSAHRRCSSPTCSRLTRPPARWPRCATPRAAYVVWRRPIGRTGTGAWTTTSPARTPRCACLVQLETRASVDALEEIAAVDGVDGVFIGPSDLSASLGFLGQPRHPEVRRVIEDACRRARADPKADWHSGAGRRRCDGVAGDGVRVRGGGRRHSLSAQGGRRPRRAIPRTAPRTSLTGRGFYNTPSGTIPRPNART